MIAIQIKPIEWFQENWIPKVMESDGLIEFYHPAYAETDFTKTYYCDWMTILSEECGLIYKVDQPCYKKDKRYGVEFLYLSEEQLDYLRVLPEAVDFFYPEENPEKFI